MTTQVGPSRNYVDPELGYVTAPNEYSVVLVGNAFHSDKENAMKLWSPPEFMLFLGFQLLVYSIVLLLWHLWSSA